jgi:ABC-2 type transport system permease protein
MIVKKYILIWYQLAKASFRVFLISRISLVIFLSGKIIRFLFFMGFLYMIFLRTNILVNYQFWHVLLFYLTFNLIDSTTQMLFREVYRFRVKLINGNFDHMLLKPINSLFYVLFAWTDLLDLITLVPLIILIIIVFLHIPHINIIGILLYILLIINALLIAMTFHIFVLSLAILTSNVDNTIMLYRELTGLGKLPIDIYTEPFRSFITFILPIGIMMSFPVKVVLGLLELKFIIYSFIFTALLLFLSIGFWNLSLRKYTSFSK